MILNNKFLSFRETSSRNIKIETLFEKYVGRELIISEDNPNFVSFNDILDDGCNEKNLDIDLALTHHNLNESYENYAKKGLQIAVNKFMKNHTSNDILHNYVVNFCKSTEDFFAFRKEFSYNYATAMCFSYFVGNSKLE